MLYLSCVKLVQLQECNIENETNLTFSRVHLLSVQLMPSEVRGPLKNKSKAEGTY